MGVAGVEGSEAQLWALWEAEEEERVGEAVREPGLERRPRERNAARPWDTPSWMMNFSLSSRLVRPRAGGEREGERERERKRERERYTVGQSEGQRGGGREREKDGYREEEK